MITPNAPDRDASDHRPPAVSAEGQEFVRALGPRIRSDIIDAYIMRAVACVDPTQPKQWQFLQLLRSRNPLRNSWQPVMGHIEPGEHAVAAMVREVHEEVGLDLLAAASSSHLGVYALEQVHPFYIAAIDCIVLSARFAIEVSPLWQPRLNAEHLQHRWVPQQQTGAMFTWPGQHASIAEACALLSGPDEQQASRAWLRLSVDQLAAACKAGI